MANSGPNTNGCQFFITVAPAEHLNGNYSIFGEVVSGQEVADAISKVPRNSADKPDQPVKITAIAIRTVKAPAAPMGVALKLQKSRVFKPVNRGIGLSPENGGHVWLVEIFSSEITSLAAALNRWPIRRGGLSLVQVKRETSNSRTGNEEI